MDKNFRTAANHIKDKKDNKYNNHPYDDVIHIESEYPNTIVYTNGYEICRTKNPNKIEKGFYNNKAKLIDFERCDYPNVKYANDILDFSKLYKLDIRDEIINWDYIIDAIYGKSIPIDNIKDTISFLTESLSDNLDKTLLTYNKLTSFNYDGEFKTLSGNFAYNKKYKVTKEMCKDGTSTYGVKDLIVVDTSSLLRVLSAYNKETDNIRLSTYYVNFTSGKFMQCLMVSSDYGFTYMMPIETSVSSIYNFLKN